MGIDYDFTAFNGDTGKDLFLLEQERRNLYYIMRQVIWTTETPGYPCTSIDDSYIRGNYYDILDFYRITPEYWRKLGYESLEDFAICESNRNPQEYIAWSGSVDLEKIYKWFKPHSEEDEIEENANNLDKESSDRPRYIDTYAQLRKGFKLALETKGYVTMRLSY